MLAKRRQYARNPVDIGAGDIHMRHHTDRAITERESHYPFTFKRSAEFVEIYGHILDPEDHDIRVHGEKQFQPGYRFYRLSY